ncbi:MAG TPA: DUF1002 domain-containing protein [Lachnospiraceae bacterium]|nr:DUF1002 domain-containing protein [Lachnospiraceae bacterium]
MIKNRRNIIAGVLCGVMLTAAAAGTASNVGAAAVGQTCVSLGADLNPSQREHVLSLMNLTEADLANCTVVTVTNDEEHAAYDAYLPQEVIGGNSLSSAKVVAKEEGNGINVATQNISYCTVEMYQNALVTAGVRNADVIVAGPERISGTAALLGITKAYETMTGESLKAEGVDTAANELVITSELGEELGDQEKAAKLIATLKEAVAEGIDDEEDISELIDKAAQELDITLTEEQKNQIMELMRKISRLNLDKEELKSQVKDLYETLKSEGLNLGISDVQADGIIDTIVNWFISIWEKLRSIFS